MQILAQIGRDAIPHDRVPEVRKCLEVIVAAALRRACKSLNHLETVAFAVASDADTPLSNMPSQEYRALSPRACAKRRMNWIRGRSAAHLALRRLGFSDEAAIPQGNAGEPIWPDGISGSITHCGSWSIAAVIPLRNSISLGIDLEDVNRIQELTITSVVCRPNERKWVQADRRSRERLCMLFSAKESLYKSLFPTYKRYIDFIEAELSWSAVESAFQVLISPSENRSQGGLSLIACEQYNNFIFTCSIYCRHIERA